MKFKEPLVLVNVLISGIPEVLGPPKLAGLKGVKYEIANLVFLHKIDAT
jgi:hypothetical protein